MRPGPKMGCRTDASDLTVEQQTIAQATVPSRALFALFALLNDEPSSSPPSRNTVSAHASVTPRVARHVRRRRDSDLLRAGRLRADGVHVDGDSRQVRGG